VGCDGDRVSHVPGEPSGFDLFRMPPPQQGSEGKLPSCVRPGTQAASSRTGQREARRKKKGVCGSTIPKRGPGDGHVEKPYLAD
jgi:hypothetical protein